jgi:hypothetical protein
MTDLEVGAQDACAAALRKHGFVAKRRGVLLRPGGGGAASGWLGLNLATWGLPDKLQVNPVVGVRHLPVERALVELAGWAPPIPSVSRPLGYLMPDRTFRQWDFAAGGNWAAVAGDLADAVATYGQPFIEKWSDWETFSSEVEGAGLLLDVEKFIVLPIVAAIDGDRARAERLIQQELDRVGGSSDAYAKSFREFARKFAGWTFDDPVGRAG